MARDKGPYKTLIIEGDPAVRSVLEEFLKEGPYEILFVQTGTVGLKIPPKGKPGVGTADLQLRNLHGLTGLKMSNSRKIEARLLLVQSVELLDLTEEPHEFDAIGTLEEAGNAEKLQETQEGSEDSQDHWKSWLESYLNDNFGNPDLSFGDLMRKLRFSRSYGCRLFQQHFGKSFLEKLREIRIAQAVQFVTETRMYMKEIAVACGFRSSTRLHEAFKRIHGISPGEYRKRYFKKDGPRESDTGDTLR